MNKEELRNEYISKCKHLSLSSNQCYLKSGYNNGFHFNIACNGECARMKRWDKIHKQLWKQKN